MNDYMYIAKQIRDHRIRKGISQEELGNRINQSKQTISNWECGKSRPSFEALQTLEETLGFDLRQNIEREKEMSIKQLHELSSIEETEATIKQIIDAQHIYSPYKDSLKKMLELTLWVMIGFYRYIEAPRWEKDSKQYPNETFPYMPPEWADIACELGEIIDHNSAIKSSFYEMRLTNPIAQRIGSYSYIIGAELFEDFDDDGYRNGYIQQVGRYAEKSGYDLVKILPPNAIENSLISEYRIAILNLAEYLS